MVTAADLWYSLQHPGEIIHINKVEISDQLLNMSNFSCREELGNEEKPINEQ